MVELVDCLLDPFFRYSRHARDGTLSGQFLGYSFFP